jgi:malonate-semialdehyde dehydrogenase (acetylating)/methylmalonate-semialdehyde dehydrogenase
MLSQQVRKAFSKVRIQNFINGEFVDSCSEKTFKMLNPADGECTGEVPLSTSEEFKEAVEHAKVAFETWKETPIMVR